MVSLASAATNPGWYTNPVTGAVMGAIGIGSLIAGHKIGQGRKAAKKFVDAYENPFGAKLAEISNLAATDPTTAAQELQSEWEKYVSGTQSYISEGGNEAKVAQQSLANSKLMKTVNTLATQLGITLQHPNGTNLGSSSSATANPTGSMSLASASNPSTSAGGITGNLGALAGILGPLGGLARGGGSGGANTGTGTGSSTTPAPNTGDPNNPDWQGPLQSGAAPPAKKSLLSTLLPWILAGTNIGTNLYGIKAGTTAANTAANLEAQSAANALALQKQIWEQTQANAMPFLNVAKGAAYTLADAVGMPRSVSGVPAGTPMPQWMGGAPMLAPSPNR